MNNVPVPHVPDSQLISVPLAHYTADLFWPSKIYLKTRFMSGFTVYPYKLTSRKRRSLVLGKLLNELCSIEIWGGKEREILAAVRRLGEAHSVSVRGVLLGSRESKGSGFNPRRR